MVVPCGVKAANTGAGSFPALPGHHKFFLLASSNRSEPARCPTMTLNTVANQRMILTGDRERFKELLRRRLIECGWRDQVRMLCRETVKENDGTNISIDTLVNNVTPRARALVPDTVKKELLQKIKNHLLSQKDM